MRIQQVRRLRNNPVQKYEAGDGHVDAICFTGGSEYGFGAIAGVTAELLSLRGYSVEPQNLVQIPGTVIYDFPLRDNVRLRKHALLMLWRYCQ